MRILAALSLIVCAVASACSSQHEGADGAQLKIDSGWFVGEGGSGDNTIPGVMWLGMCTSTAVSDNTLLFAGHCVQQRASDGRVSDQICIKSGTLSKDACAEQVWVPESWARSEDFHMDIAVAIFKRGTFKRYFEVNEVPVKVGDKVFLVGYSEYNLDRQDKGSKRWGYQQIQEFDEQNVIITHYGRSGNAVAVSPGDSGGPLMKDCKVSGVASRMSEEAVKLGLHTNITDKDSIAWLKSLRGKGAEFCGLSDAKAEFCDTANRAEARSVPDAGGGQPIFPCTETGTAGGGSTTNPPAKTDVYLALDESDVLHVSAPAGTAKVLVCFDKAPSACTTEEIAVSSEKTINGRPVHKTLAALAIGATSPRRIAIVAKDAAGKGLATLAADLKKP